MRNNMQNFTRIIAGFFIIGLSQAQMLPEVILYPMQQMLVEGDPFHFVCRVTQPITSCRIALPSGRGTLFLHPNSTDTHLGVEYFGQGFEAGECGLKVSSSDLSSHGTFSCSMSVEGSIFEAQGHPKVDMRRKIRPPSLTESYEQLNDTVVLKATCTMKHAKHSEHITWYLGTRQITHGIQRTKQDVAMRASNTISETLVMDVRRRDNGTKLRCVAQDMDDVHSKVYSQVTIIVFGDQIFKDPEDSSLIRTLTAVLGGVFLVLVTAVVLFMLWRKHAQRRLEVIAEAGELDKRSASPSNGVYWAKTKL